MISPAAEGTRRRPIRTLVGAMALFAACGGAADEDRPPPGLRDAPPDRADLRLVFVLHGQSSDPFWSVVSNGVHDAARDLGVRADVQSPLAFDMVEMSQRVEAAVASRPEGLVVSIPDADALGGTIRRAVDSGIPVVSINSGGEIYRELGVLAHVGQTEYEAGYGAGERLVEEGVRKALCVNHEVGNAALDLRCQGFADALARSRAAARVLTVDLADPEDARQRIERALAADPTVDGVLTLGPNGASPALAARRALDRPERVRFATFDLSPQVLAAVRDGAMLFAVDQQPYLQGYLPVVLLVKYRETGAMPGGGEVIRTGPAFVTRDEAAAVIDLSARGLR